MQSRRGVGQCEHNHHSLLSLTLPAPHPWLTPAKWTTWTTISCVGASRATTVVAVAAAAATEAESVTSTIWGMSRADFRWLVRHEEGDGQGAMM